MRILVVTHNYPRFAGDPAGAYVARLAAAAASDGATVQVLAPHAPGTAVDETVGAVRTQRFRYGPAALERIGYRGDTPSRAFRDPLTLAMAPFYLGQFRRSARRAAARFAPNVVHAHWWFPAGWAVSTLDIPYVVTSHGSDVRLFDRGGWWRRAGRRVLQQAGAVTAVSQFLARDLERHAGPFSRPVTVTPMPVDVELFAAGRATAKSSPPRILYAGNLVGAKGVDVLLHAHAVLRHRGVSCRLKILGEGPAKNTLERLAGELGTASDIDWSPFVPQDRMPAEYGASLVTVLPSRGQAEGLGLTLVEALLSGSAVVATPAGGIPEVVQDGETGLLARDGDPEDLANKLARVLEDAALRDRLVATGTARVRDTYSPAAAARRFLALYDDIAARHPAR
jgi:glycosyltransferase involved in cell wall biosynthesis